jgi:hypothetical protein
LSNTILKEWNKLEIGEKQLHYRKFLVQTAKKKEFPIKSNRVGRGVCLVEIFCDSEELEALQQEATKRLQEKQEKWRNRGLLPPEEATWQKIEFDLENRELRDLIVKRARSKRFRARTGNIENGVYIEVLCHPEQMEELRESAEEIIRAKEWDSNLDNPNYSLYKKLSANPLKTDEEVLEEQNKHLETLVSELKSALKLFKEDKDEHYYEVNQASKSLYREVKNLTNEGKMLFFRVNNGRTFYVRWIGERFKMFFFEASGDRHPQPYVLKDILNLSEVENISI